MAVVFSHNTALELLRSNPQMSALPKNSQALSLKGISTSPRDLMNTTPEAFGIRRKPIHVLVSKEGNPVRTRGTKTHIASLGELPAQSLFLLTQEVWTSGPELTFIQMATDIPELGLIVLGYELCGMYSHFSQLISGFYDRPALTNTTAIIKTLEALPGMNGVGKIRSILPWILNGSRSPMETVVSCELFLPARMGGWALKAPKLNYRIALDDTARRITGTKSCSIDVAWPEQKIGFEYDGGAFHLDTDKDRRRREALARMGWTTYVVGLDEIHSYQDFVSKVELFADQIPHQRGQQTGTTSAKRQLFNRLLHATRFGLGLDAALFAPGITLPINKIHI